MMKIILLLFISIISLNQIYLSDNLPRETRAVWVTTNFALDWPPKSYDEKEQKLALRNIFEDIRNRNFNTVYFQVRSNGTVLYNSVIEPFSPYFKGEVGFKPNYDPLQYAIELGREFNLEVHAWVNMMRCFSGSDDSFLKHPRHIRNSKPELTVRVMDENGNLSYWMNPGYFKSQEYLVDLLLEISSNYDIDGIQLDFFRYPGKNFDDQDYFSKYGLNTSLEDWRRNNLTMILRKFKEKVKPLNPFMKIGVTPIGIRRNLDGAVGWEGYSEAFQDTETWLSEGLVDYLAPQIYWDFENNPKFDVLAKDWVGKSNNKNIVLGLAAYKNDVKTELSEMIEFSREIGAAGISFFRYNFLLADSEEYFNEIALPKNMPWKEEIVMPPHDSINSKLVKLSDDEILIEWDNYSKNINRLFRSFLLLLEENPVRFFSLDKDKIKLKFGKPSRLVYNYRICKLDRLWNCNSRTKQLDVVVPYLYSLKRSSQINTKPTFHRYENNLAILSIFSPKKQSATIDLNNIENIIKQSVAELEEGINFIAIKENLELLKSIRIVFSETKNEEELTFFN